MILDQHTSLGQKMNGNTFRKLRPLTCVSPAQTAQPMCASVMPRLTPQPPPQRQPGGMATMREIVRQNRIIMRDQLTISSRPQSVKLPPVFGPSHARVGLFQQSETGLCPHPPAQGRTTTLVEYGIRDVQPNAEISRPNHYKSYRQERKENLFIRAQRISQKESAISERELKAANDLSIIKPCLEVLCPPEAIRMAQDAKTTRMKTGERNLEALERKVRKNKMEGMVLTEPEEEEGEETYRLLTDLSSSIMWENTNFEGEMHTEKNLIKSITYQKKKMQEKADRIKEELQNMALLIERKEKELTLGLKNLNYLMRRRAKSDAISRKMKVRQYREKMVDVHMDIFDCFCSPHFPSVILSDLNDWSSDLLENTRPETRHKLLQQILKDYAMRDRLQKQAEAEALREERRQKGQKRLERALCPPVKIIGKKLIPRSQPPKVIKKEEPVETQE